VLVTKEGPVYCDCCGRERLATVRNGKLVVTDRRGGTRHTVVFVLDNSDTVRIDSTQDATAK
jgi:hypothetical protein